MRTRLAPSFIGLGVAFFAAALGAVSPSATTVHACSIGSFGTPERQRDAMLEALDGSDLVIVGVVLEETRVGVRSNFIDKNDVYESRVRADAVLAGDSIGEEVRVGQLGYHDSSCSGGPRLREGERVLLALDRGFVRTDGAAEDENVWRLHHFLGKVLIVDDEAISQYASLGIEVGSAETLIRSYGKVLGSDTEQMEMALVAAIEPVQPDATTTGPTASRPMPATRTRYLRCGLLPAR